MKYTAKVTFNAMHEGGTKFYQVIQLVQQDGASLVTNTIGHYGPMSKYPTTVPSRFIFSGKTKIYGRAKSPSELAIDKRKGGYKEERKLFEIGGWNTKEEMFDALGAMGLYVSPGDRVAMGFTTSMAHMRENAERDIAKQEESEAPVTKARQSIGSMFTTAEENPIVGTW